MTANKFLVLGVVLAMSSCASAFFGWGSTEERTPAPHYVRLISGHPSAYSIPPNDRQQIPAVPMQVPLQAQLAPMHNIQNVQLVPCLCPVTPDYPYEQPQNENIYVSAIPIQQLNGQHQQPTKA